MLQLIFFIVTVVFGVGWFVGYRYSLKKNSVQSPPVLTQYFLGVNYLLNEQPDQAVDAFLKALEINVHTAEICLALGNLFRKQGKLERAIRMHQTLFDYPNLGSILLGQAHLELAEDYLASGIFNQSEEQLLILLSLKYQEKQALELLLNLYQIQQEWEKEIDIAMRLVKQFGVDKGLVLEHCYCELAEQALKKELWDESLKWLRQASKIKSASVRTNYLLTHVWLKKKEPGKALKTIEIGLKKSSLYWSELLLSLVKDFWHEGYLNEFIELCCCQDLKMVGLGLVESLFLVQRRRDAEETLKKILQMPLYLIEFKKILNLAIKYAVDLRQYWPILETQLLCWAPQTEDYLCKICGFNSRNFYWCCPGCHSWESIYSRVVK